MSRREQLQAELRAELTRRLAFYEGRKVDDVLKRCLIVELKAVCAAFVNRGLDASPSDLKFYVLRHARVPGRFNVVDATNLRSALASGEWALDEPS